MDYSELKLDDKLVVARLLETLKTARQVAYEAAKDMPALEDVFVECEARYRAFAARIGAKAAPVFDRDAHIANRIEKGDRDYVEAFGDLPRRF